jgi:riboflavin synthase
MFTGIVTDVGEIRTVQQRANNLHRLTILTKYPRVELIDGASVACSGVCMTVVETGEEDGRTWFAGHMVAGHVDGLATVIAREDMTDMARIVLRAPRDLARFIAPKGSVALDGISLTVNAVEDDTFSVLIIPHTLAVTTFGALKKGDDVNLEVDTMARYAARLMESK